ncbi:retrovirus-related pol polyprotein from transposon TNT 1-94 [Tanacetum coccineum]
MNSRKLHGNVSSHIPPQKRNNREANTPLPRKETVSLVKKTNVNLPARSENVKRVDNPFRNLNKRNRVDSSLSVKRTGFISKSDSVCKTCNECLVFRNHNKRGVKNLNYVNAKNPEVKNNATMKQVWKATGKIFASVCSKWKPTGKKFTLGDTCPLTRITKPEVVPLEKSGSVCTSEPANNIIVTPRFSKKPLNSYKRKDRKLKDISTGSSPNTETKAVNNPVNVNDLSANQLDPNKNWVSDFQNSIASSVFQCRNDQFAAIVGYGDYNIGDTIITRVNYVEGLSHNLFSVGQFCDAGLEVAFRKYTCYIRNKDKVDLLKGSRTTNLYSISLKDMMEASPVCLLSKASSTKSWLWHHRLNHLNFETLNELAQKDLVRVNTNTEVLNTLHMDLCGPIRVESINGKKYILVIVDDYTRFSWVRFLRTKDETPKVIKKFIILTQRALNATVCFLRTDNGMEFVNKTLTELCESVGITHNTTVPQTPQQNGVVKRWNQTLMEAARTMLIFAKAPMFLWAEVVATACYTLNRSLVHTLHEKTYYELLKGKKPNVKYFRVFGSLCYPTNDYDDLGKLKAKADIEHGRMILESVEHGPLIWPTIEENGVIRTKKYVELSAAEKIQADCDMEATNIILQGLPADIYSLVNHHRVAKDLWERRINDMNIYKMNIEKFQVNTKFLNSLPPEWIKFVTDVKLVKDLHTSNFDQLHAYIEQHELHANEVCIMRECNQDPLAFFANQQMIQPHFNPYQSSYNNP